MRHEQKIRIGSALRAIERALAEAFCAAALLLLSASFIGAQHTGPTLHISNRWKECSIQLDPLLTQKAWRQFTGEAGMVTYFRPLADAAPLGKGAFELSMLQWKTGIDANDAAWNDTFVHPDDEHWLFEGSGLSFPGLTARVGATDRTDIGVYVTKNPNANYGFYGAQVQHNLLRDGQRKWFLSTRANYVSLFGPEDLTFSIAGADLVASRTISVVSSKVLLSPYAVVSGSLSRSHERTSAVDLRDESVYGAHATVGAVAEVSVARVALEYAAGSVSSLSLKIGIARK